MGFYNVKLSVFIFREGKRFIAYTPSLDLSTSGKTFKETQKRFEEAVQILFEELEAKGTREEVLSNLGWRKVERRWQSPVTIAHEMREVKIPA